MTIPKERYKDTRFIEAIAAYARQMMRSGLSFDELAKRMRAARLATTEEVVRLTKEMHAKSNRG